MTVQLLRVFGIVLTMGMAAMGQEADDPFGGPRNAPPVTKASERTAKPKIELVPSSDSSIDETEMKIRQSMSKRTSLSFVELPLADAAKQLAQAFDLPILIDAKALEEIGLSAQEPVNVKLRDVSLRSILRLMLNDLELTYIVKNEVLMITTVSSAESNLITRAYQLPACMQGDPQAAIEAIHTTVVPDTWDVLGGPSTIALINSVVVISTTECVHEDTIDMMRKTEAADSLSRDELNR
ncbi:DUF4974 domain-containing protein [Rubripirellula reticaptiva]|uniref:Secretin/TonB short N-terminal domain-containing protein n=1 Tax=Rubripirellula reticaptiva TaxID=2528013 RepID=A0A5C6F4S9_9BACT|nr:DUF4974 domain-containing protein [Rubripirellula reticaptiva]TWU55056.1 hypothetical protein Poly59_13490 [Rubripirellula reticaptiva]